MSEEQNTPLQLNEFSKDAKNRSEFFYNFVKNQNLTLLPGRYGGEYNNDHVAIGEENGEFLLFFGTKIQPEGEGIQLDPHAMGPFMQGSVEWLKMIVLAMRQSKGLDEATLTRFEQAIDTRSIRVSVLFVDLEKRGLSLLPIYVESFQD
ncbi:hypothetical protein [Pseudoalteromonas luteoviolacea]|uniref:Uncharacterized protein n=1 Tax=Pseudoalteromonas luteoviolacea S4054 TaxID=1129367 RepID=A0A0F6ABI0_9GAMM|nr:hypothetical protein [Pseudoalteromonas luteoviolacea]AOT09540.1 hypothetical protein S4054249_17650 [Pseudoalteromonas luteoviolacea]AOT14452.1 hypothetical protein S40542_17620 [Pseudoalteromonas luteoviolacea]AOT19368.1 hypothetical protein S4054_17625 [Pseudoalteromonas luteoviolacea]KKE83201.1 hypothetical protein N479_15265 [Pseudoalteromonas luteoviolacea S4054]KZN68830.1 hypothetical protein N481_23075 [Pseudoalteromonas luteoviolacea S4047-1]